MSLEIKLEKQPIKYLASVDQKTRNKLYRALDKLKNLEGDIVRLKIQHYRILFSIDQDGNLIIVSTINTRTNIKY